MKQEYYLLLIGSVLSLIWLFVDYRWFKWIGISPIWGSLKQKKDSDKINVFAIGVSIYSVIFNVALFLYYEFTDKINNSFSYLIWIVSLFMIAIVFNISSRLIISFSLRKSEIGQKTFVITISITGGILAFLILGLIMTGIVK